jgi:hypothetical protein
VHVFFRGDIRTQYPNKRAGNLVLGREIRIAVGKRHADVGFDFFLCDPIHDGRHIRAAVPKVFARFKRLVFLESVYGFRAVDDVNLAGPTKLKNALTMAEVRGNFFVGN